MKISVTAIVSLVAIADARVAKRLSICCFGLSASGGPGGPVGQLGDGQARIGQGLPPSTFCINDGGITDLNGRGCILTPPTSQLQCDAGATPTGGFNVGCDGTIYQNGDSEFWSCATGDNGGYNIYASPIANEPSCVKVTLTADGCRPNCPAPPPPACPTPVTSCPTNLNGNYEFPHLIIPVDSANPNKAYGTQYNGQVTPTVSTIFNFDIPASDAGKKCSLVFLLPLQSQLETSSFTISGSGQIDFSLLSGVATQSTNYANAPGVKTDYGVTTVAPGNSYNIATFDCPANTAVSFELKSVGGTALTYFQDYNPSPIGLYITKC